MESEKWAKALFVINDLVPERRITDLNAAMSFKGTSLLPHSPFPPPIWGRSLKPEIALTVAIFSEGTLQAWKKGGSRGLLQDAVGEEPGLTSDLSGFLAEQGAGSRFVPSTFPLELALLKLVSDQEVRSGS
jgi:hypothetical protein